MLTFSIVSLAFFLLCSALETLATVHYRNATHAVWTSPHFIPVLDPVEAIISTRSAKLLVERQGCLGDDTLCPDDWCCTYPEACCGSGCCPSTYNCVTINGVAGCCAPGETCNDQTVSSACVNGETGVCPLGWCCDLDESCSSDGSFPLCVSAEAPPDTTPTSTPASTPTTLTTTSDGGGSHGLSTSDKIAIISLCVGVPGTIASIITIWAFCKD